MAKEMLFDYPYFEDFGGQIVPLLNKVPVSDDRWTAFNPSIAYSPDLGYAILIRSSNYSIDQYNGSIKINIGDSVRNYLWFSELDSNLNLLNFRQIDFSNSGGPETYKGIEDARLFCRDGSWKFTGVMMEAHTPRARMVLYSLDPISNKAFFVEKYESWDPDRSEKNWMTTSINKNPYFDYIYGSNCVVKDKNFYLTPVTSYTLSTIRGGSCLWPLKDGSYLAVAHCVYTRPITYFDQETNGMVKSALRNYTHIFVRYDHYGKVLEVTDEFVFEGPGVEFAAGLVEKDEQFVISYGREDVSSSLAIIDKNEVFSRLQPVTGNFFDS
jgi:hypothetical protein